MCLRFPPPLPSVPASALPVQVRQVADQLGVSDVLADVASRIPRELSLEHRSEQSEESGVLLSAGGEAALRPSPPANTVSFPDSSTPATTDPTSTSEHTAAAPATGAKTNEADPALSRIIELKQLLKGEGLDNVAQRKLENELVQLAHEFKTSGKLNREISARGESAWTELRSIELIPDIHRTLETLRAHDDRITFHNLYSIVSGIAAQTAKTEGIDAGSARAQQVMAEIRTAAAQGKEALGQTLSRLSQEAGVPFNPSLQGSERYNPFVNANAVAATERGRATGPEEPENSDSRSFQQQNSAQIGQVMGRLNQRGVGQNLMTPSALSDILARQAKFYDQDYAEQSLNLLVEASQNPDPNVLKRVIVSMAEDAQYVFHPGLAENDPRRYNPFEDRGNMYDDQDDRTTLVSANNSRFRIGISSQEGFVLDIGGNSSNIRAPKWFISLMSSYQSNPEQMAALLLRSQDMLSTYNRRPIDLSPLAAAYQPPAPQVEPAPAAS